MGITLILAVTGALVLQEGPPSRDPKVSSCLTHGNESSKETHVLTKPGTTGKGRRVESTRVREPGGPPCHTAGGLRFHADGVSFQVVSGQSSCLAHVWSDSGTFPVAWTSVCQDGFQCKGFWKVDRTYGVVSPPSF